MTNSGNENGAEASRIRTLPFSFAPRFFVLFGCASLLLIPAYLLFPPSLLLPLGLNALLLLLASLDYFTPPSPRDVRVERLLFYPLTTDRPNEIPLEIHNTSSGSVSLIIQDDIPDPCRSRDLPLRVTLRSAERLRLSYHLTPEARGRVEFGNVHYWVVGALGLVWKHGESAGRRTVKLYPGLSLIEKRRLRGHPLAVHDMVWPMRRRGAGTEFDSLREYTVGDDWRLIHWGTTARKGRLVVRQNRVERGQTIFLVLDAGRMMTARVLGKTKFDYALQAALLLAYAGLEAGDKIGIMVVGQDVMTFVTPANDHRQFGRILDATYALEPSIEEPRFHLALSHLAGKLKRRALVVVFTDLIDERASEGLTRYCLGLRSRHLPLVAAMSDTEVVRVADAIPSDAQGLYRQGVAAEILERRGRLLAKLGAAGTLVLDVPPDKISSAVLDRYLDIKTRNVL